MLVRGGMRTVQTIGVPAAGTAIEADALVVALKSRTIPAAEAVAQSLAALEWLRAQGCKQFFFKYCSTFDSTDEGNIGPVADALLDALKDDFTIACPAFPENGRTIFRGNLFVGDVLLNESGMENHPLTPMTDPNLVRVLQRQTKSKVGLIRYDTIVEGRGRGARAHRGTQEGRRAPRDRRRRLRRRSLRPRRCLRGPEAHHRRFGHRARPAGELRRSLPTPRHAADLPKIEGKSVVLAGSASKATNAQVAEWRESKPSFRVDPMALSRGEPVVEQAIAFAQQHADEPVLIYATSTPDEVKAVQKELGVEKAGHLVEAGAGVDRARPARSRRAQVRGRGRRNVGRGRAGARRRDAAHRAADRSGRAGDAIHR